MGTLIDSSVFIAVERGKLASDLLRFDASDPAVISAVTASELLQGVHRASPELRQRRESQVEAVLRTFPIISFDETVARVHAELIASLNASGASFGAVDLMIAATAFSLDFRVLTLDGKSFPRITGLRVELIKV